MEQENNNWVAPSIVKVVFDVTLSGNTSAPEGHHTNESFHGYS